MNSVQTYVKTTAETCLRVTRCGGLVGGVCEASSKRQCASVGGVWLAACTTCTANFTNTIHQIPPPAGLVTASSLPRRPKLNHSLIVTWEVTTADRRGLSSRGLCLTRGTSDCCATANQTNRSVVINRAVQEVICLVMQAILTLLSSPSPP